jgi:hypothetical protein
MNVIERPAAFDLTQAKRLVRRVRDYRFRGTEFD